MIGISCEASASPPRETVVLDDGSQVEGKLVEYVDHDHVTLELDGGEVRRFDWSQIRSVNDSAATTPAPAAAAGVIMLKDGTVLHGDVVESVAGDHVSIRVPSGETRRVAWDLVAGVATGTANTPTANVSALINGLALPNRSEVVTDWPEPDRTAPNIPAARLSVGIETMVNGPLGKFALAADLARQWGIFGLGLHFAYGPNGQIGPTVSEMLTIDWSYGGMLQQGLGIGLAHGFKAPYGNPDVADRVDYLDADVSHFSVFLSRRFMLRATMGLSFLLDSPCMNSVTAQCSLSSLGLYGMGELMFNFGGDQ